MHLVDCDQEIVRRLDDITFLTIKFPVRPSIGERILVNSTCNRALETAASSAMIVASSA